MDGLLIDELYSVGIADLDEARDMPCNTGLILTNGSQSVLARVHPDKRVHRIDAAMELSGAATPSSTWPSTCWPTRR